MIETDRSRAQTSHSDIRDSIGHMQEFLAPVQLTVTQLRWACVTQCACAWCHVCTSARDVHTQIQRVGFKLEGEIWS